MSEDLTTRCLADAMKANEATTVKELRAKYCGRCMNQVCGYAERSALLSLWGQRMLTQEDRLLNNPNFAEEDDPRFEFIRRLNFQDLAHRAIQMEIADRRGDWQVPEIPKPSPLFLPGENMIADLPPAPSLQTEAVDEAVRVLAAARGREVELPTPIRDADHEIGKVGGEVVKHRSKEGISTAPSRFVASPEKPAQAAPRASARRPLNTPMPASGLMLGGQMAGVDYLREDPGTSEDPWAVPTSHQGGARKVEVGATVVLGGKKK